MRAAARYVPDEIGTASAMFSSQTHSENAYTTPSLREYVTVSEIGRAHV